jgi:hypothetical protein
MGILGRSLNGFVPKFLPLYKRETQQRKMFVTNRNEKAAILHLLLPLRPMNKCCYLSFVLRVKTYIVSRGRPLRFEGSRRRG